ncbi:hypothetical protein NEUTE1DRAFT_106358 [Neurospora tetrasperma FGSC 2508]|uniref:Uncharacterized protein n=1 Tax=Neurospora tetrasperma (strain FGSC 2508 / ATCC MYA-4615 / P0657) TaxID=510951 RepID=F8N3P6_NEUT8|nr:uncharacterized protein NEUTE1DRAFT_106358 [Neurospora tetrasperma FGSC 2508]EGO53447.1 hypothetical protein NEUTE1DRAFT_106358 [Neurospora tetrasperma FGSC 2508]
MAAGARSRRLGKTDTLAPEGGLPRDKVRLQPQTGRTDSRLALWNRHLDDRRHELVVFGDNRGASILQTG